MAVPGTQSVIIARLAADIVQLSDTEGGTPPLELFVILDSVAEDILKIVGSI